MRVAPLEAIIARSHGDPTNGLIRQQWVNWSSSVDRFVVISGCSSSGKSTLIGELGNRGYGVVDEPGRRIVKEELASVGSALPWVDGIAFARRVWPRSSSDDCWVVDAIAGAKPGAVVDRRVDPALGERYRLQAASNGASTP
jgi:hypothetical protein